MRFILKTLIHASCVNVVKLPTDGSKSIENHVSALNNFINMHQVGSNKYLY